MGTVRCLRVRSIASTVVHVKHVVVLAQRLEPAVKVCTSQGNCPGSGSDGTGVCTRTVKDEPLLGDPLPAVSVWCCDEMRPARSGALSERASGIVLAQLLAFAVGWMCC